MHGKTTKSEASRMGRRGTKWDEDGKKRDERLQKWDERLQKWDGVGRITATLPGIHPRSIECKTPFFAGFSDGHVLLLVQAVSSDYGNRQPRNLENDLARPKIAVHRPFRVFRGLLLPASKLPP